MIGRRTALAPVKRYWRSRYLPSGLTYWAIVFGTPSVLVIAALCTASGFLNGWAATYELLIGIGSPATAAVPAAAFPVSLVGWLIVPATVGGLAGFLVQKQITGYRYEKSEDVQRRLSGHLRQERNDG